MKVGYAQADITPNKSVELAGFGVKQETIGVYDPLYVRVLYFDNDKGIYLIQTDLVGIDRDVVYMLANMLHIDAEQLMICCSHTHSGPTGTVKLDGLQHIFGTFDDEYMSDWLNQTFTCCLKAKSESTEAKIGYQRTLIHDIGSDRHDNSIGDDNVAIFVFELNNNKKILLYSLACHPTILNGDNRYISADLPYGVIKELADEYEGVMFINGSAGDISTRFTRSESTHDEVIRKGKIIADKIKEVTTGLSYQDIDFLAIDSLNIKVNLKEIPDLVSIKAKLNEQNRLIANATKEGKSKTEIRLLESTAEGYNTTLSGVEVLQQLQGLNLNVTLLKISDKILVGLPVELFSKLTLKYHQLNSRLHFISYCNGYYLYLTNEVAYEESYYEAGATVFAKGEGERIMAIIYQKLLDLKW